MSEVTLTNQYVYELVSISNVFLREGIVGYNYTLFSYIANVAIYLRCLLVVHRHLEAIISSSPTI